MILDSQTILVDEISTNFRMATSPESQEVLVLLHGWNEVGAQSWQQFIHLIDEQNISVLAPDMPGFGLSGKPKQIWTALDYAFWVQSFLSEIKIKYPDLQNKSFSIMGHSFGGAIATLSSLGLKKEQLQSFSDFEDARLKSNFFDWLGEKKDDLKPLEGSFDKLIMVAPAIIRNQINTSKKVIGTATGVGKSIFALPGLSIFYSFCKKIWYKLLGSKDYEKASGIKKQIMQVIIRQDLQKILPLVTVPTLICWGTEDTYTPFSYVSKLQTGLNCFVKLEVYDGVNHGIHLNATERLLDDVSEFLEGRFKF